MRAQAMPSCLLGYNEAAQVKLCEVVVCIEAFKMGKNNRRKLMRLAMDGLMDIAPQFPGCPQSVGGMLCSEPEKGGAK